MTSSHPPERVEEPVAHSGSGSGFWHFIGLRAGDDRPSAPSSGAFTLSATAKKAMRSTFRDATDSESGIHDWCLAIGIAFASGLAEQSKSSIASRASRDLSIEECGDTAHAPRSNLTRMRCGLRPGPCPSRRWELPRVF